MHDIMDAMVIMTWHARSNIDDKEFKRLAFKTAKKAVPAVAAGFLKVLQQAKHPRDELEFHTSAFLDLLSASVEVSQMSHNCIGLLIHESVVYPVRIDFLCETVEEQQEDAQWLLQNEMKLLAVIIQQAKRALGVSYIDCKVLLFNNRGFSGVLTPFKG